MPRAGDAAGCQDLLDLAVGPGNLPGNLKESMASSGTPKKN